MKKNNTAHSWDAGILAIACGYTTNIKPGPEILKSNLKKMISKEEGYVDLPVLFRPKKIILPILIVPIFILLCIKNIK